MRVTGVLMDNGLKLGDAPLPDFLKSGLRAKGIEYLTPPQELALRKGLLRGKNVLVVAPTASGKTLVAEMALINAYLKGSKGVYVTPLKTLANEKFEEFSYWESFGVRVGISTGDYDQPGEWLRRYDIIVATYERMDSIYRLRPSWLSEVGVVVIDEFHTIGNQDRGAIVELLAVKAISEGKQLVGLSATVGNPKELAEWLGSELVLSNWRPVELIEGYFLKKYGVIKFTNGRVERVPGGNLVAYIGKDAIKRGYQALIFRQARNRAESTAKQLARLTRWEPPESEVGIYLRKLRESATRGEIEALEPLMRRGVAFHHAGLSLGARKVVEEAFREGAIRLVSATPTLAAGVNMPARRVVIYTRRYEGGYLTPISIAEYKQMAGRAGRPQYDPYGEAIVADASSDEEGLKYIRGEPEPVRSTLVSERSMRIHVLALIASEGPLRFDDLYRVLSKTLAFRQLGEVPGSSAIEYTLEVLSNLDMIRFERGYLRATKLGLVVNRLYVDPVTADAVVETLRKEDREVPAEYYLTLIAMTPDFSRVRVTRYREMSELAEEALERGEIPEPIDGADYYDWLRAFKIGLILKSWVNEVSEDRISETFRIGVGDLHSLVETATWLTYASYRICEVSNLRNHARALSTLWLRVKYGVKEELLDLISVKGVGRVRARILWNHGIRSVEALATSRPKDIASLPHFGPKVAEEVIKEARKIVERGSGPT